MSRPTHIHRWRWRRRVVRTLGILAATFVVLAATLVIALRVPGVRQALLRQAGDAVATSTSVHATARDFTLVLRHGELTIDDVVLRAAPGAQPFLTVPRIQAVVSWGSLFADRFVVRSLRLAGLHSDLGAPLPDLPREPDPPAETAPPAVDVEQILLTDGSVDSGPLPAGYEMWLDAARADGVEVEGSYRHGTLRLHLPAAKVVLSSARRPPVEAALDARLGYDANGVSLEDLKLEGEGLRLAAVGHAGLEESRSGELSFSLQMEPALLLPDLTTGGRLDGTGELTVTDNHLAGKVRLDVQDLPAEILRPWITSQDLELEGTVFDADADLTGDMLLSSKDDPLDRLVGHAEIAWRRGGEQLVAASLRSEDGDGPGIRLAFEAEVLPGEAGTRRLAGALRARRWLALDQGDLVATRFDLEVPDLEAAANRLGLPPDLGGFRPAGAVRATANVRGPLLHPDLDVEADWLVDGASLAAIRARTPGGAGTSGPLHLALEVDLLPASAGHKRLTAEVRADDLKAVAAGKLDGTRLEDLRLKLQIPDLAAAAEDLRRPWRALLPGRQLPMPLAEGSTLAAGALDVNATGTGPVLGPRLEITAYWRPATDERILLELIGDASAESPFFTGQARLQATAVDVARFAGTGKDDELSGRVTAALDFDGDLGAHRAILDAEVTGLRSGDGAGIELLILAARSDGAVAEIDAFSGSLTTGQTFSGQGRLQLALLPVEEATVSAGEVQLELPRPIETLERLIASLELADGVVAAEIGLAAVNTTPGDAERPAAEPQPVALLRVPLAALTAGAGEAWLAVSNLELEPFLPLLELAEDSRLPPSGGTPRPRARFDGTFTVDLADPMASTGTIEISDLALEGPKDSVKAADSLRLELRDRRLELEPGRLLGTGGGTLEVRGQLLLAPDWRPGDDPATLASDLMLNLDGSFETSALNPLLAGARASGELDVTLEVRGPPAAPTVQGRLDGPGVELFHAAPYVTRIAAPVVDLVATSSGTTFTVQARLNGGELAASGSLDRTEGLALAADFSGVRYRLDYGLTTRFGGDLTLRRPAGGPRSRLTGNVVVERGSLRNDVVLDRETLARLMAPDMTSTEDASANDLIDLDLAVTTAHGVSVKNNLGELRADWSRLRVRGTLQNPVLSGQIDVDPGGMLTAYGQTLRIDQASIDFSGDSAAPRVVFETTSSLEDPSIKQDRRRISGTGLGDEGPGSGGYWDRRRSDAEANANDNLTSGIIDHLTDQAAGSLTRGLARTELSLEPLQIFGETDTTARLTATQRISEEATLIYSVNPRDAEGQTYILELHEADLAPSLTAQVFTNDDNNNGVTLQQTLQLGAGRRGGEQGRRLGGTRIHAPEAIDQRRLKRALGLRKNDPFPDDAEFDVEADATAALRRQGYPGAAVRVAVEPATSQQRPVLDLVVDPGPRVRFVFEGTRPSGPARRSITQAYQPAAQEVALKDLRSATVKALRGEGYLDPEVEVTVGPTDEDPDEAARTLRIMAFGGRRVAIEAPELEGLAPDVAQRVAGQFDSQLSRVELAMAIPGADSYLRQSLAAVGHPEARITSRRLSDDGKTLAVRIEPGIQPRLARVEILGLPAADVERLLATLPVKAGDPMRSDLITRAAHTIEDELHRRGHVRATVRTALEPLTAGGPASSLLLRFEVDAGPIHRIAGVRLEGLDNTRPAWASRLAGLEPGEIFRDDDVGQARRRLMATGLFEGVLTRSEPAATTADPPAPTSGTRETTVIFDLDERARYLLSYGGRWESSENLGVVVDAVDLNFLGRGTTMGVRAIYAGDDDRSLRLYHAIPRIVGPNSSLELFLEGKNEDLGGLLISGVETWTQLTFALSRRARNRLYFRYQDLLVEEAPDELTSAGDGQRLVISSLGWQFSVDTRDRALGAQRPDGLFAGLDLVGTHGDVSALGVFGQLKLFTSLAEERAGQTGHDFTWAQSFRVGLQEPFQNTEIPSVSRLRAGGEYSVRGYRRDSLGPLDEGGDGLGGEMFLLVNQELRFPVRGGWLGGLVFFDAGNVWASREALDSELLTSVGVGLRAATPAGPLRLDVALPLDRRPGVDDSYKVYVGFGHVF